VTTEESGNGDQWTRRAATITVVWQAVRAPLCWTLGALLTTFLTIAWFVGHDPAPYLVMIDGGLLGIPFTFASRGGGRGNGEP